MNPEPSLAIDAMCSSKVSGILPEESKDEHRYDNSFDQDPMGSSLAAMNSGVQDENDKGTTKNSIRQNI